MTNGKEKIGRRRKHSSNGKEKIGRRRNIVSKGDRRLHDIECVLYNRGLMQYLKWENKIKVTLRFSVPMSVMASDGPAFAVRIQTNLLVLLRRF